MSKRVDVDRVVKFGGHIAHNFLTVLISERTLGQLRGFYSNIESRKLAREWFALQVFLMLIAISSHFKDNPEGIETAKVFRKYIVEGLAEAGVYESEDKATKLLKNRLDSYDKVTKSDKNYLLEISIQFLKYIEQEDALLLANTGEQISIFLKNNTSLIKTINTEIS